MARVGLMHGIGSQYFGPRQMAGHGVRVHEVARYLTACGHPGTGSGAAAGVANG